MAGRLIEQYRNFLLLQKDSVSPVTVKNYCDVAEALERFVFSEYRLAFDPDCVNQIRGYMLEPWLKHIGTLKYDSRVQYTIYARKFLKFLYTSGHCASDLSTAIPTLRQSRQKYYGQTVTEEDFAQEDEREENMTYTPQQIRELLSCAPESKNDLRDRAIILMLVTCGLRASELSSLNLGSFAKDTKRCVYYIGKGGKRARSPVPASTYDAVMRYLVQRFDGNIPDDGSLPLFVSSRGNRMSRFSIYNALAARQNKCGVHTGVHRMRHTFVTAVEKNYGAAAARDMARHNSLSVTNRYTHTTLQDRMDIAEKISDIET